MKKAFSLVEILLAMVLFTIFSTSIVYLSVDTLQRDSKIEISNDSLLYAREGLEVVRNIRDRDYLALVNGEYGLNFEDDVWSLTDSPPEIINDFYSRTITIKDAYRDAEGNIAETGTVDPEMKKITAEVTWMWQEVVSKSSSLTTYLANWRSDDWTQTTCAELNEGVFEDVEAASTASPPENNCALQIQVAEEITSDFASSNIGHHGDDVVVDGNYAFVATYDSSDGLTVVDVSDPLNPDVITTVDVDGKGRTVTKHGDYLYMGVTDSNDGLAILDISDPENPDLLLNLDIEDYGNQSAAAGDYLYMTIDDDDDSFQVIDISTPSSPEVIASIDFGDDTNVISLDGSYAYVGADDYASTNFKVIDISNPANPNEVGGLSLEDDIDALALDGVFAYAGVSESDASLQVLNIADPENPSLLTTLDIDGKIRGLALDGDYLYASTNQNDQSVIIINVSNPLIPSVISTVDLDGKGNGIDINGEYIYMGLDVSNKGLVINRALVTSLPTSGTFITDILDTTSTETIYNFIEWEHTDTPGGSVKFQIRTADSVSNLALATWVGSDGTNATYYETSMTEITLDPSANGTRYLQIKAFITSDGIETPTIESININYIP